MARKLFLTTVDNIYDPYTQFSDWLMEDKRLGHDTCELIARISVQQGLTSDEEDDEERFEDVIDEILRYDFQNIYKKVYIDTTNDEFDSKCVRF